MNVFLTHAADCIARCRSLAKHTEESGFTTRTFLSPPMRGVHDELSAWMRQIGAILRVDAAGNLAGVRRGFRPGSPVFYIGSHLDTVPHAGAFDGILGVVIGLKLLEMTQSQPLPFDVEVLGFSEEEGVRFGFPFIGSRAFVGDLDAVSLERRDSLGISVRQAIQAYGLDPDKLDDAVPRVRSLGYLEFHIEQGPVLESRGVSLGVVDSIAGQSRFVLAFEGRAGHAGTTPMSLRNDALTAAAEWILHVEEEGRAIPGLVATVGRVEVQPGASNVIPGSAVASLDVRHVDDLVRKESVSRLLAAAEAIAQKRNLRVESQCGMDQSAVAMNPGLLGILEGAVERTLGLAPFRMTSGAGHDAMVVARSMPAAMLFLRSPGGLSHHPDESVLVEDVAAALQCGIDFLHALAAG